MAYATRSKKRNRPLESNNMLAPMKSIKRERTTQIADETNTPLAARATGVEEASPMRDVLLRFFLAWIQAHLYKGRFSTMLSKLPISKQDKTTIRRCCPQVLKKKVMEAVKDLEDLYVKKVMLGSFQDQYRWQSEEFLYADQCVVHTSTRCQIVSATKICKGSSTKDPCMIKCYYRTQRLNSFEQMEFVLHQKLVEKGCSVPTLFPPFETEHYRCYPMERVSQTLSERLVSLLPTGLDNQTMLRVAEGIAMVLHNIHASNFKYIDVSMNNVGFSADGAPVLFDFGAARESCNSLPVKYFTARYASCNALRGVAVTICDDFESLGYLLLDCCADGYSLQKIGLLEGFSLQSGCEKQRAKLLKYCAQQDTYKFFKDYFTVVSSFSRMESLEDPGWSILRVIKQSKLN